MSDRRKRPRMSIPVQRLDTKPSELPDKVVGRGGVEQGKEYIWEDGSPRDPASDTGWLPLDWAGRKKGYRQQQDARFRTKYLPGRQNNYVDLTQPPGTPLNRYQETVDLAGEQEQDDLRRIQQLVQSANPALMPTLENLIAKARTSGVEIKQETTGRDYHITIAADNPGGSRIRSDWPSLMTKTKQQYASNHRMVYDTGAMGTSVSWELAKRLGIVRQFPAAAAAATEERIDYQGRTERTTSVGVGGYAYATRLYGFSFWVLVSGTYTGNKWVKITTNLDVSDKPRANSPRQFSLFGVDSIKQLLGKHRVVFTPG